MSLITYKNKFVVSTPDLCFCVGMKNFLVCSMFYKEITKISV